MALKNAFANLVTEGLAVRLNYLANALGDLPMLFDTANSKMRVTLVGETLPTVTTVGTVSTVTTVTTVSTVTTVGSVTNTAQIGGVSANSMILDAMDTAWASAIRDRIT